MASNSPITVSLSDLEAGTVPFSTLEAAFGPSSLGIILVKDLPSRFIQLRHRLLSQASLLANLPDDELAKLENPSAKWLVGWSRGRETLQNGVFDTQKGSYYVNCTFNDPPPLDPFFPEYTSSNIWPDASLLPAFRDTFESLCRLIVDTAILVARACDRYAEHTIPEYRLGCLEEIVRGSKTTKARLLHYFPPPVAPLVRSSASSSTDRINPTDEKVPSRRLDENDDDDDDWCTVHLDHGCLTGLTSAMYVDETNLPTSSEEIHLPTSSEEIHLPTELDTKDLTETSHARAGLYILSRTGTKTKIAIPKDQLAFQTGEALQVITRGRFMAVPHFVRGPDMRFATRGVDGGGDGATNGRRQKRIARNTLAVFTQPNLDEIIDHRHDEMNQARGDDSRGEEEEGEKGGGERRNKDEPDDDETSKVTRTRKGITFGEFAREIVQRNQPVS